ncbi:hypothetical protein PDM28_18410 [Stenotrophomonas aracearum]|uniref:DUF6966 domain-containing protein n=1 Tax=Stenotrophomonas aracearum TaxID=3003272 RepID=A0ABY9YDV4_9GAMM|nr:hypothetical protein [Stenotrophomonas sp. A5588]WNH48605.1 hypothetical protein PDM28_18410 [Stenotrophomonas sp. A5588]
MTKVQDIDFIICRMITLLRASSLPDWALALERHQRDLKIDPISAEARILAMYGGMGSLSDIVLYLEGRPAVKENNEFDDLRERLYTLCSRN